MTDNLKNAVPEFIYRELDRLGSDKIKKLTLEDLRFILSTNVERHFNIKYPDTDWVYPVILTILRKELGLTDPEDKATNKPTRISKSRKPQEKPKLMGVPPVRMYKGGHVVGKLLAKRTDLPRNMLGKLIKNGLENDACNDDLTIGQIKSRFNKVVSGKDFYKDKKLDLSSEMLRKSHNDAKFRLIQKVVKPNSTVLDVGAGRGGDLSKWKTVSAKLTMIDPDTTAVAEAKRRAMKVYPKARISDGDILALKTQYKFDYICYNFSLQYIFKDKLIAKLSMDKISNLLKTRGKFFGIIPDADKIKKYTANWTDRLGNSMSRQGSNVSFYLVNTPFYENGPVEEPMIGMNYLKKLCFEYNLRFVWSKDLIPKHTGLISDIYTMFLFEKMPVKLHRNIYDTETVLNTDLESMIKDIVSKKKITNVEDLIGYTQMKLFNDIRQSINSDIATKELESLSPYIRIYANRALLSVSPTRGRSNSPSPSQRRTSPSPSQRRTSPSPSPSQRRTSNSPSPSQRRRSNSPSPFRLRGSPPQRRTSPQRRRSRSPTRK